MAKRKARPTSIQAALSALKKAKVNGSKRKETVKTEPMAKERASKRSSAAAVPTRVHPLLMDDILETVFEHLFWPNSNRKYPLVEGTSVSVEDVKVARLVCKRWNEAATKLFRRGRSPLMFGAAEAAVLHPTTKTYDLSMHSFLDVMKTSSLIPVQRYVIGTTFFVQHNQRLMKDFMRICCPSATELRFYFDNESSMNFNKRGFSDFKFPKLKSLLFNCGNYKGRNYTSRIYEIGNLVEVVLGAAEGLQEFRFEFASQDVEWQSTVVQTFADIIPNQIPKTLKILCLNLWLDDSNLNTLSENGLKLQEFQFDCRSVVGKDVIRKFFERQSSNLKVLKILSSDPNCSTVVDFPRMDRLRHMELQGGNVIPFSYPATFPKLEILNLSEWKNQETLMQLLQFSKKKATSLHEIFLPSRFPESGLVRKVAQCFPNIKSVHIAPSPDIAETLKETFVYLPDIEELRVSIPFQLDKELDIDSIFSGVSEVECRRILKRRNFDDVNIRDVQKNPSITYLEKLKKLVIDDSASDIILTDFSAHFTFMKMDSLKELATSRCDMSWRYVALLQNKLALKLQHQSDDEDSSDDSIYSAVSIDEFYSDSN